MVINKESVVGTVVEGDLNVRSSGRQQGSGVSAQQRLFPQTECLFCNKQTKYIPSSRVKEKLVKCQTYCADDSIKEAARNKNDFAVIGRIADMNLATREAKYHESCRRSYLRRDDRLHHTPSVDGEALCWTAVRLMRMSMLRKIYLEYMESKHPEHFNDSYPSQKLKTKLINHFGPQLQFWLPSATCKSELVFSFQIDIGEAVDIAFESATSDTRILQKAAAILNKHVVDDWSHSQKMPWSPSAAFLNSGEVSPPNSLIVFLKQLITGKKSGSYGERVNRICGSIAQDICTATTRGQWTMPKHILLSMSLRQLTKKEEVITILNRYGHCQSYIKVLELETAMANRIHLNDSLLSSNISTVGNVVSHFVWDDFDVNEATPSGCGTTHITHGIVVQKINQAVTLRPEFSSVVRTKEHSFKHVTQPLRVCYAKKKTEPVVMVSHKTLPIAAQESQPTELLWMICRFLQNTNANVPDWAGWVSKTTETYHVAMSNIGYMTPIFNPATDQSTVKQCLITSMEATKKLQQEYTFVTFDLAMAKIAYNIVWDMPDEFKNVIIHLGGFHIMCSYMGVLGKMMTGTGFEVIASGVCASGSINQVL